MSYSQHCTSQEDCVLVQLWDIDAWDTDKEWKKPSKIRRNLSFTHCALCKSLPYMLLSHIHKCLFQHPHLFIGRLGAKENSTSILKVDSKKGMVIPHVVPSWAPMIPFLSSDGLGSVARGNQSGRLEVVLTGIYNLNCISLELQRNKWYICVEDIPFQFSLVIPHISVKKRTLLGTFSNFRLDTNEHGLRAKLSVHTEFPCSSQSEEWEFSGYF